MRVSTQFPIAVHVLMMVAYFPQKKVTSDIVAQSAGCNAVIIRNIFSKLKKAGLLSVKPGKSSTTLARPAEEITLWDVYTAVESDETDEIFKFHENTSEVCPIGSHLRGLLLSHLDQAIVAMKEELSGVTLSTMAMELQAMNGGV